MSNRPDEKPWPLSLTDLTGETHEVVPADLARELYEALKVFRDQHRREVSTARLPEGFEVDAHTPEGRACARYEREVGE